MLRNHLLLLLVLFNTVAYSQDTIWVKSGDTTKLYKDKGEWHFRDGLPDGLYCSYYGDKTKRCVSVAAAFKKGVKNGIEKRHYICDKPYAIINWKDGKKHGAETHYNPNGTVQSIITYSNGVLNGLFVKNWMMGQKHYDGYYKNGFRDSIWSYYRTDDKMYEQFYYEDGKELLLNKWVNDTLIVRDGKGKFEYTEGSKKYKGEYSRGLKHGNWVITDTIKYSHKYIAKEESQYTGGLLFSQTIYYGDGEKAIKNCVYQMPEQTDTVEEWVDTYITDVFYKKVKYIQRPVLHGFNSFVFNNGVVAYSGSYYEGSTFEGEVWYYYNTNKRMEYRLKEKRYIHYDSLGVEKSKSKVEYLTKLTDGRWFANNWAGKKNIEFSKNNTQIITPAFTFLLDGKIVLNQYLECGKDLSANEGKYYLLNDMLIMTFFDGAGKSETYKYKITKATDLEISLKRQ